MLYTNFSQNWNNILLNDAFSDIRIDDSLELYQHREIKLQNMLIGSAKIVALRRFTFSQLTDNVAYAICGHNMQYLRAVLQRMHGKLNDYDKISWVIYEWQKVDLSAIENLWQQAWEKTVEKVLPAYRDTQSGKQLHFALDNS